MRARGVAEDWIKMPSIVIEDTKLAVPERTVALGNVTVDGLASSKAGRTADGHAQRRSTVHGGAGGPKPRSSRPHRRARLPAAGRIGRRCDVRSGAEPDRRPRRAAQRAVEFEDRSVRPAARFELTPLERPARNVSLDLARALPVESSRRSMAPHGSRARARSSPTTGALAVDDRARRTELRTTCNRT